MSAAHAWTSMCNTKIKGLAGLLLARQYARKRRRWGRTMARKAGALLIVGMLLVVVSAAATLKVKDPGVRGEPAGAGGPLPGLTSAELAFFQAGLAAFLEVEEVKNGLGPRFNFDTCSGCHSQPAIGGTSPSANPQIAVATKAGAKNVV